MRPSTGSGDVSRKMPNTVLWVTNLAAPYRLPVWNHLSKNYKLTVGLLESKRSLEGDTDANRGNDWMRLDPVDYDFMEFPAWKHRRGEARHYVLKSFRSMLTVRKFDVILFGGWESPAYWCLLAAALAFRTGRVGFYESPANTMTYRTGFFAWMRSKFFRSMDIVVVPGEAAAGAVRGMKVPAHRILQGFNAVDVSEFYRTALNSHLGPSKGGRAVPKDGHAYLYIGQLISRKRIGAIIDAFSRIAGPDDELTIVGGGALRQELQSLAARSHARITFLEPVEYSDVPLIMASHHTLVLASEREVWGLVINEALASGMHVVVSSNCGVFPSVRTMHGVYEAEADLQNLAQQMQTSKADWRGRIVTPEILLHTPERFAEVFDAAFVASVGAKTLTKDQDKGRTGK